MVSDNSTIQTGAVISILGVMLQASAANLTMMLVGRIVSGFSIGMMSVGTPIYLSECAYRTDSPSPPVPEHGRLTVAFRHLARLPDGFLPAHDPDGVRRVVMVRSSSRSAPPRPEC